MSSIKKENKVGKIMIKNQFRKSLFAQADNFLRQLKNNRSLLINIFAIGGTGKTSLIKKLIPARLEENHVKYKVLSVSSHSDVTRLAIDLLEWMSTTLITSSKEIISTVPRNDPRKFEGIFSKFYAEIQKRGRKIPFVILIDDLDSLSFDDLDWFQSVVIEGINFIPQSAIVIASHNELSWHSWELRNRCRRIQLTGFTLEEVNDICSSPILSRKIFQLSAGHPATIEVLLDISKKKYQDISKIGPVELAALDEALLKGSKEQIEANLSARTEHKWLREVFWQVAAADGFDTDLVNEIIRNSGINIPDDVTDIAWEMAYTGLAAWDFDEKRYRIFPELRERIIQHSIHSEKNSYIKKLTNISKIYQLRSKTLPNKREQIILSKKYLAQVKKTRANKSMSGTIKQQNIHIVPTRKIDGERDAKMRVIKPISTQGNSYSKYIERTREQNTFIQFLRDGKQKKWILNITGKPGLGKSRLLGKLYDIAKDENYKLVFIDLHERKNRYRQIFLLQIITQLKIRDHAIESAFKSLEKQKTEYTATTPKESFEDSLKKIASLIVAHIKQGIKNKQIVLFIDTLDSKEDPSIYHLETWLSQEFLSYLKESIHVVIAGRTPFLDEKGTYKENIETIALTKLDKQFTHKLVSDRLEETSPGHRHTRLIDSLADGNPLIADWLIFFLNEDDRAENLLTKYGKETKRIKQKEILDLIAQRMWQKQDGTMLAFQAAVHFGSHFNLDLFEAVIPKGKLGKGQTHKNVFKKFTEKFYVRTSLAEKWTLHDHIRELMLENKPSLSRLTGFSKVVVKKYYSEKIESLSDKKRLSLEVQVELADLKAQKIFHQVFADSKSYHLELWDLLDNLWHGYQLDQMFQIIQFGREVQKWNANASEKKDPLLKNLLDAAQAWMFFSADDYRNAKRYASKVISSPHRRLRATGNVVLGFTEQNPKAARKYLGVAQKLYEQLKGILERKKTLNEFCDGIRDIYQELHMLLLFSGRMHWQHFFEIDEGEKLLKKALKMATAKSWNNPPYQATALNELARIERFKGNFSSASDKVIKAINIYEANYPRHLNLGYFYETLGLIEKADNQYEMAQSYFEKAQKIYDDIQVGSIEKYEATLNLEIGHLFFLKKDLDKAGDYFNKAYTSLERYKHIKLYFYLSALNKLGELQLAYYDEKKQSKYLDKAIHYFTEQKNMSNQNDFDLWNYWAIQNLAKADFLKNGIRHKERIRKELNALLNKYDNKLHREFGPAFWESEYLLFEIAKKDGDKELALMHLAKGLAHLSRSWTIRFNNNIYILRQELLDLSAAQRTEYAQKLLLYWKKKFKNDTKSEFVRTCQSFIK